MDGWLMTNIISIKDAVILSDYCLVFLVKCRQCLSTHGCLNAHVEAPNSGQLSYLLLMLLKMVVMAYFRVILPLLPYSSSADYMISILAIIGVLSILYGTIPGTCPAEI